MLPESPHAQAEPELAGTADISPVSTADICPVSTEDMHPISTEDIAAAGQRPTAVPFFVETGQMSAVPESSGSAWACGD